MTFPVHFNASSTLDSYILNNLGFFLKATCDDSSNLDNSIVINALQLPICLIFHPKLLPLTIYSTIIMLWNLIITLQNFAYDAYTHDKACMMEVKKGTP